MIRMITDADELARLLEPIMKREGFEVPQKTFYVAAVEFNDAGEVIGYQLLQMALFLEQMYAAVPEAHLRELHNAAVKHAKEELKAKHILTFTRKDETGERIARCADRLGLKEQPWKVFRRNL